MQNGEIDLRPVREMLAKVGRNLLRFQMIESGLKFMLPMAHPDGSASGDDAYTALKKELAQKTLGGLRTRLLEAIKTDDPEKFSAYLVAVVEGRNQFVHQLLKQPGINLWSEEGYAAAISYLDRQFEFTEMLFTLVRDINAQIVSTLIPERDSFDEFWRILASEGEPKSLKNKD